MRVEVAMTANAAGRSRLSREGEADKSPVASLPEAIEESGRDGEVVSWEQEVGFLALSALF